LRKQGRSVEALEMARAEFQENRNDIWFLRAYAWPLYDHVKALVDRYKAKQLSGRALSGEFAACMNEFADMADPLRGDTAFSQMLRLAGVVSRDWDDFLLFAEWAGLDSFSDEDRKPYVTDDGKTIDSLEVRFTRAICRETANRAIAGMADPDSIEWGMGVLEQVLEVNPDDQWLNFYRSRLHLANGEYEQAITRLLPVLRRQARAAWPWSLLGQILEAARPDDALVCLIHAARLAHKEQEVANIRITLASRLVRDNRFEEAALQVTLAAEYRNKNDYRVPPALRQMLASDWYKQVKEAGTAQKLPNVDKKARNLLRELDRRELTYATAVIDNINAAKALSYAATGVATGFVLLHHQFPDVAELALGTVIEVGYPEGADRVHDWRPSTTATILGFFEIVVGTLERQGDNPFAFIHGAQDDVYVHPSLAQRFAPNEPVKVTCKAIRRTNKSGKTGWRALAFVDESTTTAS
jgi:hypothetical protein